MSGLAMSMLQLAETTSAEKPYWADARAWELLAQVVDGKLSVQAMCERHRMRREDADDWLRGFHRSALVAFDEQLRQALIRQGAAPEALGGPELSVSLSEISIIDWIQAIQLFADHAVITVMHDMTESRLWCSKGGLIDAESGHLSGEAALYRIVSLERGQAVTELRAVRRERTIRASTSALLLEGARRKDEAAVLRRRLGNLERRFQAVHTEAPYHSLNTAEVAVLRRFSEPRRLAEVIEQSDLGDVETLAALESLIRIGHLLETRGEPEPAHRSEPSAPAARDDGRVFPISFAWPRERELPRRNGRWILSTLGMAALVALVAVAAWFGARTSIASTSLSLMPAPPVSARPEPETYSVMVRSSTPGASLEVDGRQLGVGYWSARLPRDGVLHELRVSAPGHLPVRVLFVDAPPPLDIALEPLPLPKPVELDVEHGRDVVLAAPDVETRQPMAIPDSRAAATERVPRGPSRKRVSRNAAPPEPERVFSTAASLPRKKKPFVQIIEDGARRHALDGSK
jgi:hypothetical protein